MPASDEGLFLGVLFGHAIGESAKPLGTVSARWSVDTWVYMIVLHSEQPAYGDNLPEMILTAQRAEQPYYSFSLERSFMPENLIPEGRKIVTGPPV